MQKMLDCSTLHKYLRNCFLKIKDLLNRELLIFYALLRLQEVIPRGSLFDYKELNIIEKQETYYRETYETALVQPKNIQEKFDQNIFFHDFLATVTKLLKGNIYSFNGSVLTITNKKLEIKFFTLPIMSVTSEGLQIRNWTKAQADEFFDFIRITPVLAVATSSASYFKAQLETTTQKRKHKDNSPSVESGLIKREKLIEFSGQ